MIENIVEYLRNLRPADIKPAIFTEELFPDSLTVLEILQAIGEKLANLFNTVKINTTTETVEGDADVKVTGDVDTLNFDFKIPKGEPGDTGPAGQQGPKGEPGDTGPAGKDAPQINDSVINTENPWSSKQIIDTLCKEFTVTGNPVQCYPVENYPLEIDVENYENNFIVLCGNNLLNYEKWKSTLVTRGSAIWENNGVTIKANSDDAFTEGSSNGFPLEARIYISSGKKITITWESDENLSGYIYIFDNGLSIQGKFNYINNSENKSISRITTENTTFITFRFGVTHSGDTIHYKNIRITIGENTDYTDYTGNKYNLSQAKTIIPAIKGVNTIFTNDENVTVTGRQNPLANEV